MQPPLFLFGICVGFLLIVHVNIYFLFFFSLLVAVCVLYTAIFRHLCGIEQSGSSLGSYPRGRGFKSFSRYLSKNGNTFLLEMVLVPSLDFSYRTEPITPLIYAHHVRSFNDCLIPEWHTPTCM